MRGSLNVTADASDRPSSNSTVLRRLWPYLQSFRPQMLVALVLVLLSALVQAAGPALIGRAVDVHIIARDSSGLAQTMLILLGVYIGGLLAQGGQFYLVAWIGQNFLANLRTIIFDKVQILPLAFFDKNKAGDLMSRLINDIQVINQLISQGLAQVIGSVFALVGILIAMLVLSPVLALASFIILPIMIATTVFFARRARQAFQKTRLTIGDVSSHLQEDITSIRVTQAFNRTDSSIKHFSQHNAANRDANVQATMITSAFTPAIDVLSTVATIIVAGFGGWLAVNGSIQVGTVVAFLIYVQQFFRPIQIISNLYTQMQNALAGAERIFDLVDEPASEEDIPGAKSMPQITGRVVFDHVSFGYNTTNSGASSLTANDVDNGKNLVLRDVSLVAEPGQTVAIIGPTGAGKSTLVNLIPRFYNISGGQVLIDGQDIAEVTLASLRSQIGLVLQENFLFSGTVADNIRYGRLDASDEEVEAAARAVSAHDFITRLPEGYVTHLGERGSGVSQGQRQLITFARAVLADPRILILDEATSSVDTRTEILIQNALKLLLKDRTAFVIAHRLSTIQDADVVLVIDRQQIVERGTHEELLEKGGLYADLYQRQLRPEAAVSNGQNGTGMVIEG
ncbi:MAG: ABC-type multidrug transport system, ATPase and permease component [Chloroflexi bacterium AL-W]|nr:ABC-type multidrug transport system, ATPase and permease component [Chloroflexi bacterium AL-N1]NOK70365.1 ABC-type multidrug transport system, ATPase and permease component [Chloroflexi bacterium AL-N10]NOK78043.1 ABC-type multidrug transport system, ATPase and permease component [Chloroflexi bacterium AL-N5]NOK85142.1 ABC-type multidrug transport system, ATPase and permease component [Chloroflexi bacterium AL-W]NOK92131.1 ABC-type multidrug transport system, ATPase and permease component [